MDNVKLTALKAHLQRPLVRLSAFRQSQPGCRNEYPQVSWKPAVDRAISSSNVRPCSFVLHHVYERARTSLCPRTYPSHLGPRNTSCPSCFGESSAWLPFFPPIAMPGY